MPHTSPGKLRSSRKRALEIGTDPAKFRPLSDYSTQDGHPVGIGMPRQAYKPVEVKPPDAKPAAKTVGTPFALK